MKRLFSFITILALLLTPIFTFADTKRVGLESGEGWVIQSDCSSVVQNGKGCYNTTDKKFYVGDGVTANAIGPGTAGSVTFANVTAGTNAYALIVGSGGSLDWGGTGSINASGYKGATAPTATEFGYLAGTTSGLQTQLNAKAPSASPTFTGTVAFPTPFTLGGTSVTASAAEMNHLVGVTSGLQTQLNNKANSSHSQAESTITFTDIATGDASTSAHGYLKKLSGFSTQFLNGLGNWVSGMVGSDSIWDAKGDIVAGTGADSAAKLTAGANGSILITDSAQTTGLSWLTKGTNNSILGVNDSGALGFYTSLYLDVPWAVGTSAAPTAEGQAYWNSTNDVLTVGNGVTATTILSNKNAVTVAQGGTNKASWTLYAIPYLSGTTTFGEIPIGTAGQYLKVNSGATGYEFGTVAGGGDVVGPATHAASYIPKWNATPNSKTLVEGVSAPSGAIVGTTDTQTLTGKTIDVEGSGNAVTIPVKIWLTAAGCNNTTAAPFWDLPTSGAAAAACVTGTNTQKGVLDFADGATTLSAQISFMLPADFSTGGNIDIVIKWLSSTTSGDVVWQAQTSFVADGETDDPSWNTVSTVTDATKATANQTNDAAITNIDKTGCAAGKFMHLKIYRDPAHASDTMAGTARLIGVEVTYRRAM
jgi:hypothetical protein